MADYRAYIVGEDGHFLDCEARRHNDDRAAIDWAKQLVSGRVIELLVRRAFRCQVRAQAGITAKLLTLGRNNLPPSRMYFLCATNVPNSTKGLSITR